MNIPLSIAELNLRASTEHLLSSRKTESVRAWCDLAQKLFDQGSDALSKGNPETGYVMYLKGVSVILEVIPKCKEFSNGDVHYLKVRRNLDGTLRLLESLKSSIQTRHEQYYKTFRVSPSIMPVSNPSLVSNPSTVSTMPSSLVSTMPTMPKALVSTVPEPYNSNILVPQSSSSPRPALGVNQPYSPTMNPQSTQQPFNSAMNPQSTQQPFNQRSQQPSFNPTVNSQQSFSQSAELRSNVNNSSQVDVLAAQLARLAPQKSFAAAHPTRLSCSELFAQMEGSKSVLILDVRRLETFIHGHARPSASNAVINVEPDWLAVKDVKSSDIETYLASFGVSKTWAKTFSERTRFDLIVMMDESSSSPQDSPALQSLIRIIYEFEFGKPLKESPKVLTGGFTAWDAFIQSKRAVGISPDQWIEIGRESSPLIRQAPLSSQKPAVPIRTSSNGGSIGAYPSVSTQKEIVETPNQIEPDIFDNPFYTFARSSRYSGTKPPSFSKGEELGPVSYPTIGDRPSMTDIGAFTSRYPDIDVIPSLPPKLPLAPSKLIMDYSKPIVDYKSSPNPSASNTPDQMRSRDPSQQPGIATPPLNLVRPPMNYTNQLGYTMAPPLVPLPRPPAPITYQHYGNTYLPTPNAPVITQQPLTVKTMARRSSSPSPSPTTQRFYQNSGPVIPPKTRLDDYVPNASADIGIAGLKNLGNTCFMNSIIQCLSGTGPLSQFLVDGSYMRFINRKNTLGTKGLVVDSYAKLIREMRSSQESTIIPSSFKSVIGSIHTSFAGSEQQDSQEFLAFLLDSLHEDLNFARRPGVIQEEAPIPDDQLERQTEQFQLDYAWNQYRKKNWSIVVDMFQGSLKSTLQCLTCKKISITFNPFMYLTLPIPETNSSGKPNGPVFLEECLKKFTEVEILDGDDAWHCPNCKKPRRASKQLTIARLPTVLLVHLKRFYFQGPFRNKVETHVDFATANLNLSGLVQNGSEPSLYDLYAVSNHFGGLNGGHYTAFVKNRYSETWYNFDDSRVTRVEERSVKTSAAYILFYIKAGASVQSMSKVWWNAAKYN